MFFGLFGRKNKNKKNIKDICIYQKKAVNLQPNSVSWRHG